MAEIMRCADCEFRTMDRAVARQHKHAQFFIEEWAGLVQMRKARETGTYVGVYRAAEAGLDPEAGPWNVVCEPHGSILGTESLALARRHASNPTGWCQDCRGDDD